MRVNEIFQSIEGEGIRAGSLATFVRLCGCNLRCSYCDTTYAFSPSNGMEMTIDEIVSSVRAIAIGNLVTLTGGEPLIHADVNRLIAAFMADGFEVNVETNGSIVPELSSVPGKLFYTMDYKCGSSGESSKMSWKAIESLTKNDVLKFVVGSQADLEEAKDVILRSGTLAQVYFSPLWGVIKPREIVEFLQEHKLFPCKVQLQLHKIIWDPQRRGV